MNTSNRTKALLIGIALPLCMAPALSFADADAAMAACVKAFVSTSLSKDRSVAVQTEARTSSLVALSRPYSIALTAIGKDSGKRLAKATCVADRNGTVIALNGQPAPSLTSTDTKATLSSR